MIKNEQIAPHKIWKYLDFFFIFAHNFWKVVILTYDDDYINIFEWLWQYLDIGLIHTHLQSSFELYRTLISHFKTQIQSPTHRRLATKNSGGRRELGLEPRFHVKLKQLQSTEKSRPTGSKPFGGLYLNWMDNSAVIEIKE